jgi:hypothetical protein
MSLGEQLNDLDRKVLGASPVDHSSPAPPYDDEAGELAPLARTLSVRAGLYVLGAVALGGSLLFDGEWKGLLLCLVLIAVPALLVAKLSTNSFPVHFPEAPADALAPGKVGNAVRLVLAGAVAAVCLFDLLVLHGKGRELLLVLSGLPAVVLWAVVADVRTREEDGFVLASRVRQRGRVGRGVYRVARG